MCIVIVVYSWRWNVVELYCILPQFQPLSDLMTAPEVYGVFRAYDISLQDLPWHDENYICLRATR